MGTRFIGLLAFLSVLAARAHGAPLPVRILAYNLHHGEGADGRVDLARIGRIIRAIDPDLAGLQEIDSCAGRTGRVDQAAEYGRLAVMRPLFGRAMAFDGGAYGNAALTKAVAYRRTARIALPGDEPRMALIADIDLSHGADPARSTVTFIDTHLMNGSGAAADRLESARRINAWADDPANGDPMRPMILVGDMNAVRSEAGIKELLKRWRAADFDYGIDWVMFRPADRWTFLRARKVADGEAAIASDHEPVVQEMELLIPATGLRKAYTEEGNPAIRPGIRGMIFPWRGGIRDIRGRLAPEILVIKNGVDDN